MECHSVNTEAGRRGQSPSLDIIIIIINHTWSTYKVKKNKKNIYQNRFSVGKRALLLQIMSGRPILCYLPAAGAKLSCSDVGLVCNEVWQRGTWIQAISWSDGDEYYRDLSDFGRCFLIRPSHTQRLQQRSASLSMWQECCCSVCWCVEWAKMISPSLTCLLQLLVSQQSSNPYDTDVTIDNVVSNVYHYVLVYQERKFNRRRQMNKICTNLQATQYA